MRPLLVVLSALVLGVLAAPSARSELMGGRDGARGVAAAEIAPLEPGMTEAAYRRGDEAAVEILRRIDELADARIVLGQEANEEAALLLEEAAAGLAARLAVLQERGADLTVVGSLPAVTQNQPVTCQRCS